MRDILSLSQAWLFAFLNSATSGDDFSLIEFSKQVVRVVNRTLAPDDIRQAAADARIGGQTALLDGIYLGAQTLMKAPNPRRVAIVLSDGGNNHSRYTEHEANQILEESGTIVYTVGVLGPGRTLSPETRSGPELMADIAARTGGLYYPVKDIADALITAERVGAIIRSSYLLSYSSKNIDGREHSVRVLLRNPEDAGRFRLLWRQTYYAPSTPLW